MQREFFDTIKTTLMVLQAAACLTYAGQELSRENELWLEQEVAALITDDERALFKDLETEEERLLFKRIFWARRDPTPSTPANELRDEYEARLQMANQNFRGSGRPGSATDMGKIFLLLGVPSESGAGASPDLDVSYSEADAEVAGDPSQRLPGGNQTALPLEGGATGGGTPSAPALDDTVVRTWVYASNDPLGIPDGLTVRFREQSGFGYRLMPDDELEDALRNVKSRFIVNPAVEYVRDGEGRLLDPVALLSPDMSLVEPSPLLLDLRETHVESSDVRFRTETSFFRSNQGSVFVPLLIDIDADTMSWNGDTAGATVVGLVENRDGNTVRQFEENTKLIKRMRDRAAFEMPLELDPGMYTLYLGVRDDATSKLGTRKIDLEVPTYTADKLQISSVLLFSEGEKTEDRLSTLGRAFVIGGFHFVPRLDRIYETTDRLSGVFIAYGFGVEAAKSKLTAQCVFLQEGKRRGQTPEEPFLSPGAEMAITVFDVPLSSFETGAYTLRVKVTDHVKNEVLTRDIGFEVK